MNIGSIGYATHSGLGHLLRDFHRNGIVSHVLRIDHPHYANYPEWYCNTTPYSKGEEDEFLAKIDRLLLFETAHDWNIARKAKEKRIPIILIPMYEYTPYPFPVQPELVLCPSLLDRDIYQDKHKHVLFLPLPVQQQWRPRRKAQVFVHNAGHGQHDFAKGTREVLEALSYVQSKLHLIVRCQSEDKAIVDLVQSYLNRSFPHATLEARIGDCKEEDLYAEGDVFINAEQFNGCSLPLQEAFASGMLVMTTDRYPANTWLPKEPLIPTRDYYEYRIPGGSSLPFQRAKVNPYVIAKMMDLWYGETITYYSRQGKRWGEDHSWEVLGPQYRRLIESTDRSEP